MSNTIEYIRYRIAEETSAAFEAAYQLAAVPLSESEHCRSYELARCIEEPNRYILRIEWDSLDGHIQGFRTSPQFRSFFAHIQAYVEAIEEMQHYEQTSVEGPGSGASTASTPTLFEWSGGSEALRRMIDCFYDDLEQSDLFHNLFPNGVTEEHRAQVTIWWAEVFGGPAAYTETLGGYDNMLAHHRNLNITLEQRSAFVSLMSKAADTAELPADPEFRSALLAYLEWGTRLAFENSRDSALPFEGATVPAWGWGEAPPYQP